MSKNILIAFILNLAFSVFEFIGGIFTGSVAIMSDAVHDIGDAASIGVSYFLEKKSTKQPDKKYTYGYSRYSVVGGLITTMILIVGSVLVIVNAVKRVFEPCEIDYNSMIVFAVIGVVVNLCAALFTRSGDSVNVKAVNLHMLEDVLGWIVVLVGAIVMKFSDFALIDPIMSIGVSVFILYNAVKNIIEIFEVFLEKAPHGVDTAELEEHLSEIEGVIEVHHMHIWSIDGQNNYATMHVVTNDDTCKIKKLVRDELAEHGIDHAVIETELENEHCDSKYCVVKHIENHGHHHGHHHHAHSH